MKKIIFSLLIIVSGLKINAQGCVAIRSTGAACSIEKFMYRDTTKWELGINNRYFKSYKHFVGEVEQKQRVDSQTEVINHSYTLDLNLARKFNERWSMMIDVPIIANTRSSLYEHGGKDRRQTHAFGIGDIRLAVYRWMIDPMKHSKFNYQLGLGLKLPTGDYKYQDYFYSATGTRTLGPVDQSIQLGDGGTGITAELNAFYNLSHAVSFYGNFYYLSNPREQNGVSTARGGTPSAAAIANGSDVMSVPDQYMYRAGANVMLNKFTVSAGVRKECIPVYDLIGGSGGFRRPGYVISVEPGVNYRSNNISLYAYVPVAVVRNRTQSVPDKIKTDLTGIYTQGDAAFADLSVSIGMSVRF